MTYDRAEHALSRARRDYHRAVAACLAAETDAARKRHARRARNAEHAMRRAAYELAQLACDLETLAA